MTTVITCAMVEARAFSEKREMQYGGCVDIGLSSVMVMASDSVVG